MYTMDPRLGVRLYDGRVGSVVVVEIVCVGVVARLRLLVVVVIELLGTSKIGAVERHWDRCGIVSRGSRVGKDGR
jgi:hypothetical protein